MWPENYATEEEFKQFLHSFGMDTWMLYGLRYDAFFNLLSGRETLRYNKLEEQGLLLSPLELKMLEKMLQLLEDREIVLIELKIKNKLINELLSSETVKLNMMDVIAVKQDLRSSSHSKENANTLFTEGSLMLSKTTFDSYTSKWLPTFADVTFSDADIMKDALFEAKNMDARQVNIELFHVLGAMERALGVERTMLLLIKKDLHNLELKLAEQLKNYTTNERDAVISRIDSLRETSSDPLRHSSISIIDANVMLIMGMQHYMMELNGAVEGGFRMKEKLIWKFKDSTQYMSVYIWDGCTPKPNCWDRAVSALANALKEFEACVSARLIGFELADRGRIMELQDYLRDKVTRIRRVKEHLGKLFTEMVVEETENAEE